ncbi:membrane biogenesis protein AsmA [Leptospira kobayashii]|uniref:Membrane biogenesis protein AsmA n=1 Tax=Leptospira kobayashii TaxID=1917830 RepID=A0ABM7UK97_9LEPT|nr:AsmA family protein [Leptospira kobayashii]BDA79340.1 membrane biogenesis protein AsmA [Leptospira kobayashii]
MWQKFLKYFAYFFLGLGFLIFALFLGLKQILDTKTVKDSVSDNVRKFVNLDVKYSEIGSFVFPFPGIKIQNLEISDQGQPLAYVESIRLQPNFFALLQKEFKISSVSVDKGKIQLTRDNEGKFPVLGKLQNKNEEKEEPVKDDPESILSLIPSYIRINDLEFILNDLPTNSKQTILIRDFFIETDDDDRSIDLSLKSEINQTEFILETKTYLTANEWSYESLRTETEIHWNDAKLSQFQDLLSVFPDADFSESKLNLGLALKKENSDQIHLSIVRFSLEGVKRKTTFIGDLFLSLQSDFSKENGKIQVNSFFMDLGKFAHLGVEGNVLLREKERKLDFSVNSDFFDLRKVLFFKDSFAKFQPDKFKLIREKESPVVLKKEDPIPLFANLKFDFKNLNINGHLISSLIGNLEYNPSQMILYPTEASLYGGQIRTEGNVSFATPIPTLQLKGKVSRVSLEPAIDRMTDDKYIKGRLNSDFTVKCKLGDSATIKNSLDVKTKFHVTQGKLLGYANFIKPVATIGQILNFNLTSKESTSFESITGGLDLYKQKATLTDFSMKGEGLSATGGGVYQTNGKIDMKFTVSLPGAVGKAVKLPILYRGIMGRNVAYIDPVWMASVYAGTVLLAGPVGTLVGGMVGSAASDNVEKVVGSVKDSVNSVRAFFTGKDEKSKK